MMNINLVHFAIEFFGTYIYVLINFITRDPLIVASVIGSLYFVSFVFFNYKGDFNPALTFPKFLSDHYTDKVSFSKIIFQVFAGVIAYVTWKIFLK